MNGRATVAARPPSITSALTESAAALIAQMSATLLGFIDAYFMAKLGVTTLATVSYVGGFVILVNASLAGALQAFLIVGGGQLAGNDRAGFSAAVHAAVRAGLSLCTIAHLIVIAAIAVISMVSASAPHDALSLAVLLSPGILVNALCLVFRLKAMLLKAPAVLIGMSFTLVSARIAALNAVFGLAPLAARHPFAALAASGLASALVCLAASWLLDRWRMAPVASIAVDRQAVSALTRTILKIGLPIGCVIVLEMSVLGIGQTIQTLLGARFGAAFGLVIQFVMLAETVAVALGQVTTINVSIACTLRHRGALLQAVTIGIGATASIHCLIATVAIVFPNALIGLILPNRPAGDAALVATLTQYLRYGAICQLLLALVVCFASVLRGMDDLEHPLVTIAVNYLGLGVLCSAALAYLTPLRDLGVWMGVAASLVSSVAFLGLRVRSNIIARELRV